MSIRSGRHFLQIPGPTNVPDRVLRAIDSPTIDHRGPAFQQLGHDVLEGMRNVFKTASPVIIFPASGTGAWEAALVNTLSPGDKVLMYETGQFATLWQKLASKLGLVVDFVAGDWRHGVDAAVLAEHLGADTDKQIKAVCVVHNETSTGITSNIPAVRAVLDEIGHPALLMVDTISSLGSIDYRHDDWGVDVSVGGSQKGLMLPPGLSFNAISDKALAATKTANLPASYWSWADMLQPNREGFFPYTPATNLLFGLRESISMLLEEGLDQVFARHTRLAEAARRAVAAWGFELLCLEPQDYSDVLTAVRMPPGFDADEFRKVVLDEFDMSLGSGLGKVAGEVFRIGHLGSFNELMMVGTLAGVEMGLAAGGVPHQPGGVAAAMEWLVSSTASNRNSR